MDKDMSARKSLPTLLSEDMRRELMRQEWEKEEEEAMNKPVGPVHYQDTRFSEIRNHGVGYYQFSTSEEQRQEQMKTLDKLREQTMEQRVRTQKLKDKRKAALDARLAKVRERKLKKLKASGELDEESNEDSGQTEGKEEKLLGNVGQPTTEQDVKGGLPDPTTEQDVKGGLPDRENDDVVSVQKAELPEWAQHKIKQPDKPRSSSHNDPRSERDQQFAPPTFYYEDNARQNTKTTWTESPKLFHQKNEINNKRHEPQTERRDIPHQELKNEHKPQEQQQLQQPPLERLPPPGYPPFPPPAQEFVQPPWTGYQWHPPPNMPPPPPHQVPWQPNFPLNVPPPPQSLWQPNIPPWQPYQGLYTRMAIPVSSTHAAWSGNPSISNPSLPGKEASTDGNKTKAVENSDTKIEHDQSKERAVPTTQELAGFVAQCRSST
ncbi:coiled-coil domain-containing protein 174-like isoform X1 [Orbicella faveolata]|uniref:coiled-coil domain-containing protein 174-like isoform X1 n=1 Tax=Orbicella faveolata TaxID=48498 RepID=UPI0009E39EF1|nr:coiled-coil domain-containing protein 174-like isoform X1 [Orbicella faveolata]